MKKSNSFKSKYLSHFEKLKQQRLDKQIIQKLSRVRKTRETHVLDIESFIVNGAQEPFKFLD